MTTQSAGRATAAPRGGMTSGRTGSRGGRNRGRSGDQGNYGINGQGGQVSGQGTEVNDGVDGELDFFTIIAQQLQNLLLTILAQVGNQGLAMLRIPIGFISWLAMEPTTIQRVVQKPGILTDEAVRNGPLKRNPKKRGNSRESSRVRNVRDVNKMTRIGNAFSTTTNPVRKEYNGIIPKCVSCNLHHPSKIPCRACFNYGRHGHMAKDCKVAPMIVNPMNARNPTATPGACYECGGTDHFKAACPRLNQAQSPGETIQTKLLLIMRDRVVGTTINRHVEGHLCWEWRRLARTRTSPEERVRLLMSAKAKEQKQEEIVVVRDFHEVTSKNSKTRVSFDQARRFGEHRYYSLRRRMVPLGCASII
uniref:CCHC-type domain-containing protein n=1 Tax=Tanacetum cinerariifolium TaxID=118510 RepID=A0A699HLQ7_TANCI|nr:hypothetical protein [Tanacetum cinerariifolium]